MKYRMMGFGLFAAAGLSQCQPACTPTPGESPAPVVTEAPVVIPPPVETLPPVVTTQPPVTTLPPPADLVTMEAVCVNGAVKFEGTSHAPYPVSIPLHHGLSLYLEPGQTQQADWYPGADIYGGGLTDWADSWGWQVYRMDGLAEGDGIVQEGETPVAAALASGECRDRSDIFTIELVCDAGFNAIRYTAKTDEPIVMSVGNFGVVNGDSGPDQRVYDFAFLMKANTRPDAPWIEPIRWHVSLNGEEIGDGDFILGWAPCGFVSN